MADILQDPVKIVMLLIVAVLEVTAITILAVGLVKARKEAKELEYTERKERRWLKLKENCLYVAIAVNRCFCGIAEKKMTPFLTVASQ